MGASFLAQNAGKRSVTVDLKTAGGKQVLTRLIAGADVLLENMRPRVLERLGFPWSRMREINPRLVYCALSGFGASGPISGRPAYDQIVQGLAGMCDVIGYPDGDPVRVGFPCATRWADSPPRWRCARGCSDGSAPARGTCSTCRCSRRR